MSRVAASVVGREGELATVAMFVEEIGGTPVALVIDGDAGIGKTTLWLEAVATAEAAGCRVLRARPVESEARLSYAALADLLGAAFDETRRELPDPQEHALATALLRQQAGETTDSRTTATAVVSLLALLAADQPTVVAIDDVQWLDGASKRALEFAARRLPAGAALLLTRRGGAEDPAPFGLERAWPGDAIRRLVLGPISLAALHHLISGRLGGNLSRPALVAIETASGGNPFFALELARELEPGWRPGLDGSLPLRGSLRDLLAERIERLPRRTRDALLVASALTRPTTALVPEADLAAADEAGVVRIEGDRVEFAHPLLASAVYSAAATSQKQLLHARLATAVEDREERARHLALSTTQPDERVAAVVAEGAALAQARGAPDAAGELYERAAALTPAVAPDTATLRLIRAAEQLFHAGDSQRARRLLDAVLESTPLGPLRGDALRLLGEIRSTEDSFPEAIRLFEEALVHVESPEVAIPLMLDLCFAHVSVGDTTTAVAHARDALGRAEVLAHDGLLAEALATDAMVSFLAGVAIDEHQLERALALEDRSRRLRLLMRPSAIAAMLAVYEGELAKGIALVRAVREWALERGEESELPFLLAHLAWAEWWRGRYADANVVAEEMLRLTTQSGSVPLRGLALLHRAAASTYLGEVEAARTDLDESTALMEQSGWTFGLTWVANSRGFFELSLGDAVAADRVLGPLATALDAAGVAEPAFRFFVPDEVEALVTLGDLDRADALTADFAAQARALDRGWAQAAAARCRGLVAAARGELAEAREALAAALTAYSDLGMPFELARTLLVLGQVERRSRRRGAATEALTRSLAMFEQLGTPLWAEKARAELGRTGARAAAPNELTETERRVAELAASGRTNREVAQLLFMSPKTVEANLARVYDKLDIHSRAELGARMAGTSGPEGP